MTPLQPQPPSSAQNTGVIAAATTIVLVTLLLAGGGALYVKKRAADARRGWNLVPVVVAAVDIAEDTVVTMEMVSQRSIPEQFVTSSVVKPDSAAYIINQKVLVPLQAGDPLLWSQFETKKRPTVLFAAHDVGLDATLTADDVVEGAFDQALLTESYVRPERRPDLLGKKLRAPFRKGDPILWTHFVAGP